MDVIDTRLLPESEVVGDTKESDEAELVRRARQGEAAAWMQLVARHQESVFRLAYLTVQDAADAEDVTQEVFIRAYLKLDSFAEARPFRPWLLGITVNIARNQRRSLGRYWAALQRFFQNEPDMRVTHVSEQQSQADDLWQAVRQLRPSAQEVIYLRYFLDLPEAEMAASLGIAPGTVKSRLHRALKQLRQVIEAEFPEFT